MPDWDLGGSERALETVAYLSRSPNRVAILDALTEGPSSRRDLANETDTSRTTLDRIVNELEERGWAERTTDGDYVATPVGDRLMREFRPFIESVEAVGQLGERVAWLPTDELDVDLRHFRDATVREPDRDDPVDTIDFMVDLLREASEFRSMTHLVPPASFLSALREGVVAGDLAFEGIVPAEHVDALGKTADRREQWRDVVECGGDLYRCVDAVPCNLWILDDLVLIKKSAPGPIDDAYGVPIVSTNSEVRSWAHGLFDQYREDATAVEKARFSAPATES